MQYKPVHTLPVWFDEVGFYSAFLFKKTHKKARPTKLEHTSLAYYEKNVPLDQLPALYLQNEHSESPTGDYQYLTNIDKTEPSQMKHGLLLWLLEE